MGLVTTIVAAVVAVEATKKAISDIKKTLQTFKKQVKQFCAEERADKKALAEELQSIITGFEDVSEEIRLATNNSHVGAPECREALNKATSNIRYAKTILENL